MRPLLLLPALLLTLCAAACSGQDAPSGLEGARQAYQEGSYLEAERLYENYLETHPDSPNRWEAWTRLLDVSMVVRNDRERSVELLETMALEFGDSPERAWESLSRLAALLESMRRWDQAAETWQRCQNIPGIEPARITQVHHRLGRVYLALRHFDLAEEMLQKCAGEAADSPLAIQCLYDLALAQSLGQRLSEAGATLGRLLAMPQADQETKARVVFLLADILIQQGRNAEAEQRLLSILDTYPNRKAVEVRLEQVRAGR